MTGLTQEQQDIRATMIGASEIPALLGLSPWQNALDVWLRKTGRVESSKPSDAMEAGTYLEESIARWYSERWGIALAKMPTLRHPVYTHVGASLDRVHDIDGALAFDDRWRAESTVVEIKFVGPGPSLHWVDEDGILRPPPYVEAQVQQQMLVSGIHRAYVAALTMSRAGTKFDRYPIVYNAERAERMAAFAQRWWEEHVIGDVQPDVDTTSTTFREWLEATHPISTGELLAPTEYDFNLRGEYAHLEASTKPALERMEVIKDLLRQRIGDADGIAGLCTYRSGKGRVDYKRACAEHDIDTEPYRGKPSRTFKWLGD